MAAAVLRPDEGAGKLHRCYVCLQAKPRDQFGPSPCSSPDGRSPYCLACRQPLPVRQVLREPVPPRSPVDETPARRVVPDRYDGPCRKCGGPVVRRWKNERHPSGNRHCPACERGRESKQPPRTPEQRRAERAKAAAKAGRLYTPGVKPWEASSASAARRRLALGRSDAVDERRRRTEDELAAREAWRQWLDVRAPASWLAARADYLRWHKIIAFRLKDARARAKEHALVGHEAVRRELARPRCPYCGTSLRPESVALDHMEPIALGGQHVEANLLGVCRPCNGRKGSRPFAVWLGMLAEPYRSRCRELYDLRVGDGRQGRLL